MSKYVGAVEGDQAAQLILNDVAAFHKAQHRYKHVSTLFFACKWEVWQYIFLHNVIGLDEMTSRYEFAKAGGMIHGHSIAALYQNGG